MGTHIKITMLVLLVVVAGLSATLFVGSVHADETVVVSTEDLAQPIAEPGQPVGSIEVQMTFDCSEAPNTPEAVAQMTALNLCGYGDSPEDVLADTVTGSCGSLSLNLVNLGNGWVRWKAKMTSSAGPMLSAFYRGDITNVYSGKWIFVTGSKNWIFSTTWPSYKTFETGAGLVFGQIIYAQSTLVWGGVCVNTGVPTDYELVT